MIDPAPVSPDIFKSVEIVVVLAAVNCPWPLTVKVGMAVAPPYVPAVTPVFVTLSVTSLAVTAEVIPVPPVTVRVSPKETASDAEPSDTVIILFVSLAFGIWPSTSDTVIVLSVIAVVIAPEPVTVKPSSKRLTVSGVPELPLISSVLAPATSSTYFLVAASWFEVGSARLVIFLLETSTDPLPFGARVKLPLAFPIVMVLAPIVIF